MYTVSEFCRKIERDLNGFIEEIATINRNVSAQEKAAMASSYPCVSRLLTISMNKKPELADAYVSTTDMLLEYKLPAASAWCDVVLLGIGQGKEQCIVIELKDWVKNSTDAPGDYEGLIMHQGHSQLHPAEQVKGYSEYCKRFHSVVQEENVEVNGCVYFTRNIDLTPYIQAPNVNLTNDYPVYNTLKDSTEALAGFIASKIDSSVLIRAFRVEEVKRIPGLEFSQKVDERSTYFYNALFMGVNVTNGGFKVRWYDNDVKECETPFYKTRKNVGEFDEKTHKKGYKYYVKKKDFKQDERAWAFCR